MSGVIADQVKSLLGIAAKQIKLLAEADREVTNSKLVLRNAEHAQRDRDSEMSSLCAAVDALVAPGNRSKDVCKEYAQKKSAEVITREMVRAEEPAF